MNDDRIDNLSVTEPNIGPVRHGGSVPGSKGGLSVLLLVCAAFTLLAGCGGGGSGGGSDSAASPLEEQDSPTDTAPLPDSIPVSDEDGSNTPPPGRVIPLGLTGNNGFRQWMLTEVVAINDAGEVTGYSQMPNDERWAWLYSDGVTRNISWPDSEFPLLPPPANPSMSNLYYSLFEDKYHYTSALNKQGWVIGTTYLANEYLFGVENDPQLAPAVGWLHRDEAGIALGLRDYDDENPRHSAQLLNDAGQVAGTTTLRHEGYISVAAWLHGDGATFNIGLLDPAHTGDNGVRNSSPTMLNEAGEAAGNATRYDETLGDSCWIYSNGATIRIGLDEKLCWVTAMNNAGQVAGGTSRYPAHPVTFVSEIDGELVEANWGELDGASAWLFRDGATVDIGLNDQEHTSANGARRSEVVDLNEAGQAIGLSYRFEPPLGLLWGAPFYPRAATAWLYEDGEHTRLGLTHGNHTGPEGDQLSAATTINEDGLIAGYSLRYSADSSLTHCFSAQLFVCGANTSWLYDSVRKEMITLIGDKTEYIGQHSLIGPDGLSESYVTYLSEKGEAYGHYKAYESTYSWGLRLFYYSRERGLHDLIDLIPELEAWMPLDPIIDGNSGGYLIAAGYHPESDPDSAYAHVGLLIAPPEFPD